MTKAPYTIFGKTKLIPVVTYTNGIKDDPPKESWDEDLWVERGEDWYALANAKYKRKTIRIIERDAWLRAGI